MKDLDDIYFAARELPPEERAAWLTEACGDDDALRARVEQMLAVAGEAEAFISSPAMSMATLVTSSAEHTGERIGRYKLLQQIGEGGFGTVWMAEQVEPVTRRVALKIIKLGMDTREVIARFEAERQALAMMDHPNIARVFDAGATDKGRPFFVMELVKGVPVTQFCDERQLGTRERLELFNDVCSAINHAHQKGIIHRDIKPSNVLVTLNGERGLVKVIDFGIAKATQGKLTDLTLFTRFEQFLGTPVYMSPEQATANALDVDTRCDIYALGILLYELLTGKPPFDAKSLASAGYEEMRRIIREVEPARPSSRLSTIGGEELTRLAKARHIEPAKVGGLIEPDLDWIVMKAIDKDRARRYDTASAFAQDIVRFLADEPVSATPPGAGYQFRKFARRNKVALRVAAGIAAVLLAGTVVSVWQAVRATQAEKKTAETLVQVAAERDAKDLALRDAEDISTFLGDVFQSPEPGRDGRDIKVAALLDAAAEKLDRDLSAQPGRRAKLQATLGYTYRALGLPLQAIPLQEKVRDYQRTTFGLEHPGTLFAMHDLAVSLREAGRADESIRMQREVLALGRRVFGPEHPETLGTMHNLANSLFFAGSGHRVEALQLRGDVLPLFRKALGPEHPDTLKAMDNLAVSLFEAGRGDEAIKLEEEVVPLLRRVLGPAHPDTLIAMSSLANAWHAAGRREEAVALLEEVLVLSRKVNGPEHPETLVALHNLAILYETTGRKEKALQLREELGDRTPLAVAKKKVEPPGDAAIGGLIEQAAAWNADGSGRKAIRLGEEALALARRTFPARDSRIFKVMEFLVPLYRSVDLEDDARRLEVEMKALPAAPGLE